MDKHWAWAGGTTIGKKARFYSRPKIKFPSHPRADNHGYVAVHLLVAEKALGKHLPLNAVVHHHTATMLVICENASYHMLLHARQNALRGCGDPAKRRCIYCHRYDDSTNLVAIQRRWYHARCRSERRRRVSAEILRDHAWELYDGTPLDPAPPETNEEDVSRYTRSVVLRADVHA